VLVTYAALAALLFDCDGVLCDTERDGHRVTFNRAFALKGLKCEWSVAEYGELLKIGGASSRRHPKATALTLARSGGKERMTKYFNDHAGEEPFASLCGAEERAAFVADLHKLKTALFIELVERGELPLRPGVARLVREAMDAGVKIAVCSTSNEAAVSGIVRQLLGSEVAAVMRVFAGDVVPRKKPDPAIYLLAARELGVEPARCVVVEDSHIGATAGKAAGMRVVVTTSGYTVDEDFSDADAVFDCIGEAADARFSLHDLTTPGAFWLNPPPPPRAA
jgi:HAD superfamily hydrolase (TIGR01509 family)